MIALTRMQKFIFARDSETRKDGKFLVADGTRVSGTLDLEPDEVLYMAWAQTQPPKFSEAELRKMWGAKIRKEKSQNDQSE